MKSKYLFVILIATTFCTITSMRSQSFTDLVKQLGVQEIASSYLKPAADAIGCSFNSGLYHTAKVKPYFHIYVGVKGMWTLIPEDQLSFKANMPSYLAALGYPTSVTTATAFGDSGAVLHSNMKDQNGNPYPDIALPRGINSQSTFLFLPHITIGSILASELMIRFIPPITLDPEIGKVRFYGFGVKHNPTQYIEMPFDLSVMISYQKFKVGDVLDVSNYNANIHVSTDLALFTLYGGIGYEGYDIKASYTYTPTVSGLPTELGKSQHFDFDFTGRNLRFTIGANVEFIPLVDFNIDYSFGVQDNFSIGAGVSL